jgi:hypothetical protein
MFVYNGILFTNKKEERWLPQHVYMNLKIMLLKEAKYRHLEDITRKDKTLLTERKTQGLPARDWSLTIKRGVNYKYVHMKVLIYLKSLNCILKIGQFYCILIVLQ